MTRATPRTGLLPLLLAVALTGCATAPSPWARAEATEGLKAASLDPAAVCPVVVRNETDETLDASYEVVGMRFDLGLLPAGQSAEFHVQCQAERVRATAVSYADSFDRPPLRFQTVARLDLARVTRLQLTQADQVR